MKNSSKKTEAVVVAADDKEGALFAFTCMLDHVALADKLNIQIHLSIQGVCDFVNPSHTTQHPTFVLHCSHTQLQVLLYIFVQRTAPYRHLHT